jgi:hypothetical protein
MFLRLSKLPSGLPSSSRLVRRMGAVGVLGMLCLLLNACAGTAKGVRKSSMASGPVSQSVTLADLPGALVVIRYPAVVLEEAEESYYRAYVDQSIGGEVSITHQHRKDTRHLARSVIAKSSYYAMSLYAELRELLPANKVLLSPHLIYRGETGASSRPLLASEEVPSALVIDFNIYTFPDASQLMDSPPITVGDVVTPMFVIQGDSWLRPPTLGMLLASEDMLQSSWRLSALQSRKQAEAYLAGYADNFNRPLDFIWFLESRESPSLSIPRKSASGNDPQLAAIVDYALEKIQMDAALVADLDDSGLKDPFAESFVRTAAQRVLAELRQLDLQRATFMSRYRAYQRFDPELAIAMLAQADSEEYRTRLRLAEAVIDAELKFLTAQSERMYRGTYYGDFGKSIRSLIAAEFGVLEKRRQLAKLQNLTTALTVVTAAGSIYATSGLASGVSSAIPWAGAAATLGFSSILALNNNREARMQSYAIGESFMSQMAPDLQRYITVQSEVVLSEKDIFARSYGEFESQVTTLYGETARAIPDRGYAQCTFVHPAAASEGIWRGECHGGKADGLGYGVAELGNGQLIEYYGEAKAGLPQGTGAMILPAGGNIAPQLLEGEFRSGKPDGIVRVTEAGKVPRIRRFSQGVESGGADEREWKAIRYP